MICNKLLPAAGFPANQAPEIQKQALQPTCFTRLSVKLRRCEKSNGRQLQALRPAARSGPRHREHGVVLRASTNDKAALQVSVTSIPAPCASWTPRWAPTADRLACHIGSYLRIFDIGHETEVAAFQPKEPIWSFSWAPDSSQIAIATGPLHNSNKEVCLYNIASHEVLTMGRYGALRQIKWSGDGRHLALEAPHEITMLDVKQQGVTWKTKREQNTNIRWSGDGAWLAAGPWATWGSTWKAAELGAAAFEAASGELVWQSADARDVSPFPDGQSLATAHDDGVRIWDWQTLKQHVPCGVAVEKVRCSPDGKKVAYSGWHDSAAASGVIDVASGTIDRRMARSYSDIRWSVDSKVTAGMHNAGFSVEDSHTGIQLLSLKSVFYDDYQWSSYRSKLCVRSGNEGVLIATFSDRDLHYHVAQES